MTCNLINNIYYSIHTDDKVVKFCLLDRVGHL